MEKEEDNDVNKVITHKIIKKRKRQPENPIFEVLLAGSDSGTLTKPCFCVHLCVLETRTQFTHHDRLDTDIAAACEGVVSRCHNMGTVEPLDRTTAGFCSAGGTGTTHLLAQGLSGPVKKMETVMSLGHHLMDFGQFLSPRQKHHAQRQISLLTIL